MEVVLLQLQLLGGITVVVVVVVVFIVSCQVCVEVYCELFAIGFLCGDDDDAVGGTCAVDGRGSGILQHGDLVDIIRVDVAQSAADGQSVDDDEGRRAGVERAHATNDETAGIAVVVVDETGNKSFETATKTGCVALVDVLR